MKTELKNGIFKSTPAHIAAATILLAALVLSVVLAVTFGTVSISFTDVYKVILSALPGIGDDAFASGRLYDVVWLIRLPRLILAIAVGASLSLCGLVMQAIVKNPLADPYILGVSSGAYTGVSIAVLLNVGTMFGANSVGVMGFAGAFIASVTVVFIANIGGRSSSVKLILAGTAVGAVCSAFSNFLVYFNNESQRLQELINWTMGSLARATWSTNAIVILVMLAGCAFFLSQYRRLNLMLLGDDAAVILGTDLRIWRIIYLLVSALMVGFAVFSAGMIGFVGLVIPHAVRILFGTDHKKLIPLCALTGALGGTEILKGIDLTAENREFIGVIGPNGSGKSTLLKCIYRVLRPSGGAVFLDGKNLTDYHVRDSARKMAVLSQHSNVVFDFTVLEMALMGRSPHKRAMERDNAEDYRIARHALETVGMSEFENRVFATLSGGERQRVMLAQALAQQTPCLILDEPTNHLDVKYQLQIMGIVRSLNLTVIAAIHDLNIAAMYCDRIYVIESGKIAASGAPKHVLTPEMIWEVYGVKARVIKESDGQIRIIYSSILKG